jgi:phenylacetate-coenzyme A ligase PaaK-like adenylate-forming protein
LAEKWRKNIGKNEKRQTGSLYQFGDLSEFGVFGCPEQFKQSHLCATDFGSFGGQSI